MARNTTDANVNGGSSHTSKHKKGLLNFGFGKNKVTLNDYVASFHIIPCSSGESSIIAVRVIMQIQRLIQDYQLLVLQEGNVSVI